MMERYYRLAGVELAIHMDENLMYEDERTLAPFAVEADRGCALAEAEVPDLGCALGEPTHRFYFEVVEELDPPRGICVTTQPDFIVWQDGETEIRYINLTRKVWEEAGIRAEHCGRTHRVQLKAARYPGGVGVKTVLNALAAERLIARNGGFVFHSSYVEVDGKAVLFTAPSETGKSTQAELWRSLRGAEIINGDRSVVRLVECIGERRCVARLTERAGQGLAAKGLAGNVSKAESQCTSEAERRDVSGAGAGVRDYVALACGIPFAGSSQICENVTLPLAAIVYLKQAPQTTIRRLRGAEAFRRVWEGCSVNTWNREDVERVSATVEQILQTVPVFELACTPDESAVLALEGVLPK